MTNAHGSPNQPSFPPPGYQQPSYQQPGYQQPGYQQPGYQQPGYQQPGYHQPGYGPPPYGQYPPGPPASRGSHGTAWLILLAVLILAGAGLGAYFAFGRSDGDSPRTPVRALADALVTHNVSEVRGALCAARAGQADTVRTDPTPPGLSVTVGAAHVSGNSGTVDVTTRYQGQVRAGSIPVVRENGQWKACPSSVGGTEVQHTAGSGGSSSTAASGPGAHAPASASGLCAHATSTRGATDEFVALATSGQDAAAIQCATGTVAPVQSMVAIVAQLRGRHFTYSRALTPSTSVYTGSDGSTLFVGALARAPYGYFITDASFE